MTRRLLLALLACGLGLWVALTLGPSGAPSEDGLSRARNASISVADLARRTGACADETPVRRSKLPLRCAHVVYAWSPSMPLSVHGLAGLRDAAAGVGVTLSAVEAEELVQPARDTQVEAFRTSLVDAGATVHFPSVVIIADGAVRGHAVVGYKQTDAYRSMLRERLTDPSPDRGDGGGSPTAPRTAASAVDEADLQSEIELLWTHAVEPPPGAFFRRVPGTPFRDYDVHWSEEGPPRIEALTEKRAACPGHDLSTPTLSKDGHEVAARDDESGTTKLFRLSDDASCTELLDLGRQTSKVGFNDDGALVAYSSPEPSRLFSGTRSWTDVLDRESGTTVRVPHPESGRLVIPELVDRDSILVAIREEARSRGSEFRVLC